VSPEIADILLRIAIMAPGMILAITLHEAAHGYVAWKLGDDTAYRLGRVTFNPLRHIDPVGTVILPALLYFTTGFIFGYAKPVPVDFRRLHSPRRDMVLVAGAGPASNLLIALGSAALLHLVPDSRDFVPLVLSSILVTSVLFNVMIGVFNMIPLPPLDGGRVAVGLLPNPLAYRLARLERVGILILLIALIGLPFIGRQIGIDLNIVWWILWPIVDHVARLVYLLTGNGAP
jgi:Zn-dependent protease